MTEHDSVSANPARSHANHNPLRPAAKALRRAATVLLFAFLVAGVVVSAPAPLSAAVSVGISVNFAPPPLPVYVQPLAPGPGYIWTPGYWAWDPDYGYYWVPGTWVLAPYPGWLWTPGYWGWDNGYYVWYDGYWGPVVGFYGGINYGCGYNGYGYYGGYWRGNTFYYNRAVNNVGGNIRTFYRTPVPRVSTTSRVSFNGGRGGVRLHPTAAQREAANRWASQPVAVQREHMQAARHDPALRAAANHGRPPIAATARPGALSGPGVVGAKRAGGPYRPPANAPGGGEHGRTVTPGQPSRPSHTAPGREGAPPRATQPHGSYEQPARRQSEPGYQYPSQGEHRAPREYAPAPAPHAAPPAGRSYAPPAVHTPQGGHGPSGAPHPAPAPRGGYSEPMGGGYPGGGGGRQEGGGYPGGGSGRPEGGHGR